jgi:hypothetical protein
MGKPSVVGKVSGEALFREKPAKELRRRHHAG